MLPITPRSYLVPKERFELSKKARFKGAVSASCTTSANIEDRYRNRTCVNGFAVHRLFPLGQATRKKLEIKRQEAKGKSEKGGTFFLFAKQQMKYYFPTFCLLIFQRTGVDDGTRTHSLEPGKLAF